MIYFILSILILIIGTIIYFLYQIKKIRKMKINGHPKMGKVSDEKIMKDLKILQKQLLVVEDPNLRIEIIKKIEIITSIYN